MTYLLDTNIISEIVKPEPNAHVISWLVSIHIMHFFISALTIGEIKKGVEKLPDSQKRQKIIKWLEIDLPKQFIGRIINIGAEVADKWGYISSKTNIHAIDGLIAASALVHNKKLVTRNIKDFLTVPGLELINPWEI